MVIVEGLNLFLKQNKYTLTQNTVNGGQTSERQDVERRNDWEDGSHGQVPALQAQGAELSPRSHI